VLLATALIHLDSKQKARLMRRAKRRGNSFSQEVRNAVQLYLDIPVESEEELSVLARAANESAKHSVKRLDETIAHVNGILKSMGRKK
jgi:Ribbon-helix-helix protein, copG family